MAKTQEEAMQKMTDLEAKVDFQLTETKSLIDLVKELRAVIVANPGATDFQPFVDRIDAQIAKLESDDADVKGALEEVVPPTA